MLTYLSLPLQDLNVMVKYGKFNQAPYVHILVVLENEATVHILFKCPLYSIERYNYCESDVRQTQWDPYLKTTYFMFSKNTNITLNMVSFLDKESS